VLLEVPLPGSCRTGQGLIGGSAHRGDDRRRDGLFSYVSCEGRVPQDLPLRRILPLVDAALADLSGEFAMLYAPIGRPSIPPEGCCGRCCSRPSI
jgi:hypothetical protein